MGGRNGFPGSYSRPAFGRSQLQLALDFGLHLILAILALQGAAALSDCPPLRCIEAHAPASYNWWNTKKIWVLGAAPKSSKLLLAVGALRTEGRAAPHDLGKNLIRFARNMS